MKKTRIISVLLAAVLCLCSIGAFASSDLRYDVNGDGTVDTKDLTRLMKFIAGQDVSVQVSDINGDGAASAKDLTRLMKYIAGDIGDITDTGSGDTTAVGGDAADEAFSAVGKKYLYGEEELVILELENVSKDDYSVGVTVTFFDGSGAEVYRETQSCLTFSDGYKRSFIFRPEKSFDSFTYNLDTESYDGYFSEKYLTVSFTGYTADAAEGADASDAVASVACFDHQNRNLKPVYYSCIYAFIGESDNIISLAQGYVASDSYNTAPVGVALSDARGNPIELSEAERESIRIVPMIYDFTPDPFGAGNGYGAETYSPVTPNRVEGQISSPNGKPDPVCGTVDEVYDLLSDSEKEYFFASNGEVIAFRMHIPADYSEEYAYPVLTVIHGLGHEGTDGDSHITSWMKAPYYDKSNPIYQCIVIYPQCPYDSFTDYGYANNPEMKAQMAALVELMDYVNDTYSTNLNRQYLMGFSAGAYATWELMERLPGRFAAAIPIAGGGNRSKAEALKDTYIYAYHDTDDSIVDPNASRDMYLAVKGAGSDKITYTETDGYDHFSVLGTLQNRAVYRWLFDKVKE